MMKKTRLKWPKPDKKPRGGDKKSTGDGPRHWPKPRKKPEYFGGGTNGIGPYQI